MERTVANGATLLNDIGYSTHQHKVDTAQDQALRFRVKKKEGYFINSTLLHEPLYDERRGPRRMI